MTLSRDWKAGDKAMVEVMCPSNKPNVWRVKSPDAAYGFDLIHESGLSPLLTLLAERGCRVVGPEVTGDMIQAALARRPLDPTYPSIFAAMLEMAPDPLEDPARG